MVYDGDGINVFEVDVLFVDTVVSWKCFVLVLS